MKTRLIVGVLATALVCCGVVGAVERDHDVVPEDYFDIASLFALEVSPDGRMAAYVESRWGTGDEGRFNDLWVVTLATGERLRLSFDGFGPGQLAWSPDSRQIYFAGHDPHGGDDAPPHDGSTQVWRVNASGGEPFAVTRVADGIAHFALSSDGASLIYTVGEEVYDDEWKELKKEYSDLEYGHGVGDKHAIWKLDLVSWRASELRGADDVIHEIALSPDDGTLAMITTADTEAIFMEGWSRVVLFDLDTHAATAVTGDGWRAPHPSPYGWLDSLAWSADSKALAFAVSFDGYVPWIYVAELAAGTPALEVVERPDPVAYSGNLRWRGAERVLCYRGEALARVRAYAVDVDSGATTALTPGDVVVDRFAFSADGAVMTAALGTPTQLDDIYLVKEGETFQITELNPQVASWKLPQISVVSWTGADGDQVEGILELPPGYTAKDGPLPLVVELHGGPTAATFYRLRLWIYGRTLMPANGYALLSPNYHGSTGFGDDFTAKLVGRENEIEVTDIATGIEAMVERGIADRGRIGVMGWSNGGYLTNAMITTHPEMFKAASSGAGVLDMLLQWAIEDTPGHVINYMQGLPWEKPEAYMKASPVYRLNKVKTPTLIHVGGADPRVPPAHSRALYRALRHYLNVPVELVVYPGEAHGLSTHTNRLAKMKWDLAWFAKYLLGADD